MAKSKRRGQGSPEQSAIQRVIERMCKARGITPYELAKRCGWAPGSIYRKLAKPVTSTAIERMFAALEIRVQCADYLFAFEMNSDYGVRETMRRM